MGILQEEQEALIEKGRDTMQDAAIHKPAVVARTLNIDGVSIARWRSYRRLTQPRSSDIWNAQLDENRSSGVQVHDFRDVYSPYEDHAGSRQSILRMRARWKASVVR